jgi:hypothetical protein
VIASQLAMRPSRPCEQSTQRNKRGGGGENREKAVEDHARGHGQQWQVAELLEGIDVFPTNCGPKRLRGYLFADFSKAFAHFRVQSSHPLSANIRQTKKRNSKKRSKRRG